MGTPVENTYKSGTVSGSGRLIYCCFYFYRMRFYFYRCIIASFSSFCLFIFELRSLSLTLPTTTTSYSYRSTDDRRSSSSSCKCQCQSHFPVLHSLDVLLSFFLVLYLVIFLLLLPLSGNSAHSVSDIPHNSPSNLTATISFLTNSDSTGSQFFYNVNVKYLSVCLNLI